MNSYHCCLFLSFSLWKVILFGLCYFIKSIDSHVLVYQLMTNQLLEEFDDWPALFGPNIPPNGIKLNPIVANPINYCYGNLTHAYSNKDVIIIERGPINCSFEVKVRNAQKNNFKAVIFYNNEGNELEQMSAKNTNEIDIPAVFVGKTAGFRLLAYASSSNQDTYFVINDELPFNINTQLILPFSILIGLCFLIMIFYIIYKCVREERRLRQYRLPKRMLKKIPIVKFTKTNNLSYDTCVICLEEFIEGDKLRILPCKHPYHSHCIDPWLTKNRRVCPVCKRKVFGKDEERRNPNWQSSIDSAADTDDDSTPLLRPDDNSSPNHGTFIRNSATQSNTFGEMVTNDEENQMSDEENVLLTLSSQQSGTRRINPFDRSPNLPPNLANQLNNNESRSIWSYPVFRFFQRQPPLSVTAQPIRTVTSVASNTRGFIDSHNSIAGVVGGFESNVHSQIASNSQYPTMIIQTPLPSANNILNPNLSGSFKDDDDENEREISHQTIYEPIAVATPSQFNADNHSSSSLRLNQRQLNDQMFRDSDSVYIQTPSHGGIGVVALPNAETMDNVNNTSENNQQEHRSPGSLFWSQFYV